MHGYNWAFPWDVGRQMVMIETNMRDSVPGLCVGYSEVNFVLECLLSSLNEHFPVNIGFT